MRVPETIFMSLAWLAGGLALFLYGMDVMGRSLRKAAGPALRRRLQGATRTRFHGLATGVVLTVLAQSSSASTVMVVGFINAGLLTFESSIGLILGANVGTTITPQITALDLDVLALPLMGAGFLMSAVGRRRLVRHLGLAVMGFGMLFFGLALMKTAAAGHREALRGLLGAGTAGPGGRVMAFVAATAVTAVIQSSAATLVMVQALALQGVVTDLETAMPLILGAGVGTCVTALLAGARSTVAARRAAVAHLLHNLAGVGITLMLYRYYLRWIPLTADDMAHQVANAHLAVKGVNALLFVPFVRPFAWCVRRVVRGRDKLDAYPRHLDFAVMDRAARALPTAAAEIRRMCGLCVDMVHDAVRAFLDRDEATQAQVRRREALMDDLNQTILDYILSASHAGDAAGAGARPAVLLHMLMDVERIGDHAENIAELGERYAKELPLNTRAAGEIRALEERIAALASAVMDVLHAPATGGMERVEACRSAVETMTRELLGAREAAGSGNEPQDVMERVVMVVVVTNLRSVANHLRDVAVTASEGRVPMPEGAQTGA